MGLRLKLWMISAALVGGSAYVCAQDYPASALKHLPSEVNSLPALEGFLEEATQFPIELTPTDTVTNPWSEHIHCLVTLDGIPIHRAVVQWNRMDDGKSTVSFPKLARFPKNTSRPNENLISNWIKTYDLDYRSLHYDIQWVIIDDIYTLNWILRVESQGSYEEIILDVDGQVVRSTDLVKHDQGDTLVEVNIYLPDPVTAARTSYGGDFIDNDDATSSSLREWMTQGTVPLTFDSAQGVWLLQSAYAMARDIDPPSLPAPALTDLSDASRLVERSDSKFEFFNAYYHILEKHKQLAELGFNVVDFPLLFDAQGTTADQSSYVALPTDPYVRFGTGGVDDAEDAEVVVHEYGHAIIHDVTPGTSFGAERNALDEGWCDYLALSYSGRITEYNRNTIFDWDGHNEFWAGRTLANARTYPTDLQNNIYVDGILWTSALAEIAELLGYDYTDELLMHSLYSWFGNMLLSDAAFLFLQSDSLLNNAQEADVISSVFCVRGLLPGCEDTLISQLPITEPYLGNSFDFAFNNEPLYIYPNRHEVLLLELFDLSGKLVYEENWEQSDANFIVWEAPILAQGMYVLRLITTEGPVSFRITKLW